MMKTFLKTVAVIVAMASLATAEETPSKSLVVATPLAPSEEAYAKLRGSRAGEEREFEIAPGVKMTFCWCPAGEFIMGSPPSEQGREGTREDQAKVTLSKGFWVSKTEVTQSQWVAVMASNPLKDRGPYGLPFSDKNKGPNHPIVGVSWDDAQKFMEKVNSTLGSEDGGKMSLPTEAQYEYAARAGEAGMYPGGNLDEVAWHDGNSGGYLKPVGTKTANAWGLHDMNGSTWEWVQDCYYVELPGGTDPIAKEIGLDRVIRGGCWFKEAARCRLATRSYRWQGASQCFSIGFRMVRNSWPAEVSKPAIDPDINGQTVTKISYQGTDIEKSFVQTGPNTWMSGGVAYTEVKRTEGSVHLRQAGKVDARVQIDLSEKTIIFRGQEPKEVQPISSASKHLPDDVKAALEKARLSSAEAAKAQADKAITNSVGMKLMPIPKGQLQMGSGGSSRFKEARHEVTITRDYYMGAFEVTQGQYLKLIGNNPSHFQGYQVGDSSNHPVDQVSWEDAVEFCKKLSELPEEKAAGRVYRLPTEAEWEHACRAGSNAPFSFGGLELADDHGWFSSNSQGKTHPVGKKDPNAWGLHDMHGNVNEWCSDWAGDYPEGAVTDPTGPQKGDFRIFRGGNWMFDAVIFKSGVRSSFPPSVRSDYVGFRVALSSPEISQESEPSQEELSQAEGN
ncbi:MAG: SUMF1/EgtB/PvdO family nonheme iron enzyme [Pirellulales bacterium]|nr:SUMF1/EgtB/PvdO family nonheme iron enzyme [Pirellulales bacterium]